MEDDYDGDDDIKTKSCAPAPRVPCVVVSSPLEFDEGFIGDGGSNLGSCLRSTIPRSIHKFVVSRNEGNALGLDDSVLRYDHEGVQQQIAEIPEHHKTRPYCNQAKLEGEAVWHKSRADANRARDVALANARDLSLPFGHDVELGCLMQWELITCHAVVPWLLGP